LFLWIGFIDPPLQSKTLVTVNQCFFEKFEGLFQPKKTKQGSILKQAKLSPHSKSRDLFFRFLSSHGFDEGMVTEEKRKKNNSWYSVQGPGRMAQTPQAGTGDSMSRFRRYHCSTVINYDSYFLVTVGEQFCFKLLFLT